MPVIEKIGKVERALDSAVIIGQGRRRTFRLSTEMTDMPDSTVFLKRVVSSPSFPPPGLFH